MSNQILVVDDEVGIRELLSEILHDEGYHVRLAADAMEARRLRHEERPDLVLLDIWMPQMDGISLLKEWRALGQLNMPVIMMSGHGSVDTAVEATRMGAFDFLEKPIALPKLLATVERAMRKGKMNFRPQLTTLQLGKGDAVVRLRYQLSQVANHNAPLLLVGEPGCGIELAARQLHQVNTPWFHSEQHQWLAENPFEPLNDSQGGILFIPEIGELNPAQQKGLAQLLGKLEKHQVKLICGSTHPIAQLTQNQGFDPDLAAKLSAVTIRVPALREHAEDIPDIAVVLLHAMVSAGEVPPKALATSALNAFRQARWAGNLPMLTNVIRTLALTVAGPDITGDEAIKLLSQFEAQQPANPEKIQFERPLREARDDFERAYFEYHIRQEAGNMSRVAERVGLERTHLYRKLKQLGIRPGAQRVYE